MKILIYSAVFFGISLLSYYGLTYYKAYQDKYSVDNSILEKLEGRWGASGKEIYFSKIPNGLTISVYESPKSTLEQDGNVLILKNQRSLKYLENTGGKIYFQNGDFLLDYHITASEKLTFKFDYKQNDTFHFKALKSDKIYSIILSKDKNWLSFKSENPDSVLLDFKGVKLSY